MQPSTHIRAMCLAIGCVLFWTSNALSINEGAVRTAILKQLGSGLSDVQLSTDQIEALKEIGRTYESRASYDTALICYEFALEMIQPQHDAEIQVGIIGDIGICYWSMRRFDQALATFSRQYRLIEEHRLDSLLPGCYNNIGLVYYSLGNYTEAIRYYRLAIGEFRNLGDETRLGTSLLNLGILLLNQGIYDRALSLLLEAEVYLKGDDHQRDLTACYEAIGLVYLRLQQFPQALKYQRESYRIRQHLDYRDGMAKSLNNIGLIFSEMKTYDSALVYLNKARIIKESLRDSAAMVAVLVNLGSVTIQQGRLRKAKSYFSDALTLSHSSRSAEKTAIYHHLAEVEMQSGQYDKAGQWLDLTEDDIERLNTLHLKTELFRLRSALMDSLGQPEEALSNYMSYVGLKDSLLNTEKNNYLAQLQVLHEVTEKENENAVLKEQAETQQALLASAKQQVVFLVIGVGLLIILSVSVYYGYRQKKKTSEVNELMMRELHHRVKNNLQLITSLLGLQSSSLKDEKALEAVKSSENRVNAMAIIHQRLYHKKDVRSIEVSEFVRQLISYLIKSHGYGNEDISLQTNLPELHLDVDKAIPLGLIINELISNALKYAGSGKNPVLKVSMFPAGNKIKLIVRDNGPGLPNEIELANSPSFGLKMVSMLCRQLKASVIIHREAGTSFEIIA